MNTLQQEIKPFTEFPVRWGHGRLPRRLQHLPVVDGRPMSPQGGMWAIRQISRDPVPIAISPMPTRVLAHRAKWAVGARICAGLGQAGVAPGFIRITAFLPASKYGSSIAISMCARVYNVNHKTNLI